MKLIYKILLGNIAISFLLNIVFSFGSGGFRDADDFAFGLGLAFLALACLNFLVGIICFIAGEKEWGQGMMASFGILLVLTGISCGTGFSGASFY